MRAETTWCAFNVKHLKEVLVRRNATRKEDENNKWKKKKENRLFSTGWRKLYMIKSEPCESLWEGNFTLNRALRPKCHEYTERQLISQTLSLDLLKVDRWLFQELLNDSSSRHLWGERNWRRQSDEDWKNRVHWVLLSFFSPHPAIFTRFIWWYELWASVLQQRGLFVMGIHEMLMRLRCVQKRSPGSLRRCVCVNGVFLDHKSWFE